MMTFVDDSVPEDSKIMLSRLLKKILVGAFATLLGWLALVVVSVPASAQQKAEIKSGALYVVTYVDVFPNFTDETMNALRQFAADSRKDPGSVRFEFLQDVVRTNHFSIVEVWRSRQAYDAHLSQEHSKRFREKIQPGLGSPFDERLYSLVQ
jgi:quinol monooxygenase YgiN